MKSKEQTSAEELQEITASAREEAVQILLAALRNLKEDKSLYAPGFMWWKAGYFAIQELDRGDRTEAQVAEIMRVLRQHTIDQRH